MIDDIEHDSSVCLMTELDVLNSPASASATQRKDTEFNCSTLQSRTGSRLVQNNDETPTTEQRSQLRTTE